MPNNENSPARQKYLDFLKQQIAEYCNSEGCYELYWDYRDEVSPDVLKNACNNYKNNGYEDVKDYLEQELYELSYDYDSSFLGQIRGNIYSTGDVELISEWESSENTMEDLEEVGYNGIEVNLDDLLSNTTVNVNVMFATPQEQNYDMSSIVYSFGNDYRTAFCDWSVDKDNLDNTLTYLIHQQGHSVKEVYDCILNNPKGFGSQEDMSLVKSISNEICNNSSEGMTELTVLLKMNGNEFIKFCNIIFNEEQKYLAIDKGVDIGLFNEWSGCGGLLELELNKPFVVPVSMVRNIQIEGASHDYGYTVNEVYGLVGDCWKEDKLSYTNEAPTLTEENLDETIKEMEELVALRKFEVEQDICE